MSNLIGYICINGEIEYYPLVLSFSVYVVTVYMIFGKYKIPIQTPKAFALFHPFEVARKEANRVVPRLGLI